MVRRTKAEAQETRAQLLDAAERLFSEKGVTATSLQDIAAATGVTRGAVYHHFKNKVDLITALWERVSLPLEDLSRRAGGDATDPLQTLRNRAVATLRHAITDPHHHAVANIIFLKCEYVDDVLPIRAQHLASRNQCAADITAEFAAAITAGALPPQVNAKRAAMGLFGYMDGLMYNWLLDESHFDLVNDAEHYIDVYFEGLKHAPETGKRKRGRSVGAL